jgi:hypothetical protein
VGAYFDEVAVEDTPIWTEIFAEGFENGFEYFTDGGANAQLAGSNNAHTGSKSLRLQDDTGTSLSYTKSFPVSSYSTLKVEFWYKSSGFDWSSDSFSLQSHTEETGTNWVTEERWSRGSNGFTANNSWKFASVEFPINTTTMRIRFKNYGNKKNERIFIDDLTVSGMWNGKSFSNVALAQTPFPSSLPSSDPSTSASPSSQPSDQPSKRPSSTPIWTEVFAEGFENGFGHFTDGGANAQLAGSNNAHTGSKSLRLQDNTGTSLSYTKSLTVSSYSTLKVEFWYKSSGFDWKSDSFSLQSLNEETGTVWVTQETWSRGSNGFTTNNSWKFASVEFPIDTTTMRIRFKNHGNKKNERIFIDDVRVSVI